MSRAIFGLLGVLLALFPKRSFDVYEAFALEDPEECTAKPWIVPAIRTEGLVFALCSLTGRTAYRWLLTLVGVAGGVALLFPRRYLDFGADQAYERPETVTWKRRFVASVRVFGAFALGLALTGLREQRTER